MDNRNEEELFITIIDKFLNDYGYTVQYHKNEGYYEFFNKSGKSIGYLNYHGSNFFTSLVSFVKDIVIPSGELR